MCGQLTPLTRDFHRLLKNVHKLTNNQVEVLDYDDDVSKFTLEIKPNDGYYKRGKFEFKVLLRNYPERVPSVTCLTPIYHPNIHCEYDIEDNVCLSLFDEWTSKNDLEDCVQGLLFLLYNPNLDDPNNPHFDAEDFEQQERFADDVQKSLEGEEVEGLEYERNVVDEENRETPEDNTLSFEDESGENGATTTTYTDQNVPGFKERNTNEEQVTNCTCTFDDKNESNDKNIDTTLNIKDGFAQASKENKATQETQPYCTVVENT